MTSQDVVFLFDVDNTLVDNDRVQDDLRKHLERESGPENRDRYWAIFEQLRAPNWVMQTISVPFSATDWEP
jgi:FMN phosphatase YigB (HAD superfamily)